MFPLSKVNLRHWVIPTLCSLASLLQVILFIYLFILQLSLPVALYIHLMFASPTKGGVSLHHSSTSVDAQ